MAGEKAEIKDETSAVEVEGEVEFAVILLKRPNKLELQNVEGLPSPSSIDDLYRELVLLVRNIEADHSAKVHAEMMMQAAMQAQGVQKSGIVTPPGVKV